MATLAGELQARGLLTASGEMLWGAINHIIAAIADRHGLFMASGAPMSRRLVMEHLQQADPMEPPLQNSLAVVGELHGYFYNKHMNDARHAAAMTASLHFVEYLLRRPEVLAIP